MMGMMSYDGQQRVRNWGKNIVKAPSFCLIIVPPKIVFFFSPVTFYGLNCFYWLFKCLTTQPKQADTVAMPKKGGPLLKIVGLQPESTEENRGFPPSLHKRYNIICHIYIHIVYIYMYPYIIYICTH